MPSSRAVFDLNNRTSGVNRYIRFCQFPKNSKMCRVWVRILTLKFALCGDMVGAMAAVCGTTKPRVTIHSSLTII